MNVKQGECACSAAPKLVFACSGAADVGAIADQAARKMNDPCSGKMFCLVGIGGRVPGIMKTTEAASKILAIDGCQLDCAKKCLEGAGFNQFIHLRVTDLGMEKGKSPATAANVSKVVEEAAKRIRA